MTSKRAKDILDSVASGTVKLYCADHAYFGPNNENKGAPTPGCKHCWMVYWLHWFSNVAPDQRQERLENVYRSVKNSVQLLEEGKWDFVPFEHPEMTIEKEV